MTAIIHINGQSYPIGDAEVASAESRILGAVHAGGAFLSFESGDILSTRVLVSPTSAVQIERRPDEAPAADDGEVFPDFAYFTDFEY